ncbi:MAG: ester cyclase, partial [Steroidobacteraceae bacterium]
MLTVTSWRVADLPGARDRVLDRRQLPVSGHLHLAGSGHLYFASINFPSSYPCAFSGITQTSERNFMDSIALIDFAARYTAAWCSQSAARVASFFAEKGSLPINGGDPAVGRAAIASAAQGFMTAFPDLVIKMDSVNITGTEITYHWTLTGTNTGPGGTGRFVRVSGFERWRFGRDGLIAESKGHFDTVDYQRQLSADAKSP